MMHTIREFAFQTQCLQPCCGATNAPCSLPPGLVYETATGCEKCGHSKSCHGYFWSH